MIYPVAMVCRQYRCISLEDIFLKPKGFLSLLADIDQFFIWWALWGLIVGFGVVLGVFWLLGHGAVGRGVVLPMHWPMHCMFGQCSLMDHWH